MLATSISLAQNGNMMNGSMGNVGWMDGYGVSILLVFVVVSLVVWVVQQNGK